jgi:hypothetical protein
VPKILVPKITKLCFGFEIFGAKILYKNACVKCWWNWLQVKAGILTIRQSASHKRAIMTFSSPLPNHHHNFFVLPLFLRRPPFPTSFKGRPNTNESFKRGFGWKFGGSSQFLDSGLRNKKNQIYRVNFTNLVAQNANEPAVIVLHHSVLQTKLCHTLPVNTTFALFALCHMEVR